MTTTIRIYLPYGAHLRFDGCQKFAKDEALPGMPGTIMFTFMARDEKGNATTRSAAARFSLSTICGYSVENTEEAPVGTE